MRNEIPEIRDDNTGIYRDVDKLLKALKELPILLYNSSAGNMGPLFDPTVVAGQLVRLEDPNPECRDALRGFTGE